MRPVTVVTLFAASAALASMFAAQAAAPPRPRLSAHRAEAAAARAIHGRAVSSKYEFEDGRWQYAVIVTRGKEMFEVEVNPTTGKILDTEKTTAAAEAKEEAADRKKATGAAHHAGSTPRMTGHAAAPAGEKAESDEKNEKGEKGEANEKK